MTGEPIPPGAWSTGPSRPGARESCSRASSTSSPRRHHQLLDLPQDAAKAAIAELLGRLPGLPAPTEHDGPRGRRRPCRPSGAPSPCTLRLRAEEAAALEPGCGSALMATRTPSGQAWVGRAAPAALRAGDGEGAPRTPPCTGSTPASHQRGRRRAPTRGRPSRRTRSSAMNAERARRIRRARCSGTATTNTERGDGAPGAHRPLRVYRGRAAKEHGAAGAELNAAARATWPRRTALLPGAGRATSSARKEGSSARATRRRSAALRDQAGRATVPGYCLRQGAARGQGAQRS